YPVTRPLREWWKWIDLVLAFSGIAVFTLLVILNSYLVGYDVVSITTDSFNFSAAAPWIASLSYNSSLVCQPHTFSLGDVFRTNISAFPYVIYNVMDASRPDQIDTQLQYANSYLESCDVIETSVEVSPGDRKLSLLASISCPPPLSFEASTTWSYSNHPVIGTVNPSTFSSNSTTTAVLTAMTEFGGTAYNGIYSHHYFTIPTETANSVALRSVIFQAIPSCISASSSCVRPHVNITFGNAIDQPTLQIVSGGPDLAGTSVDLGDLYNVLEVFYHAIRIDLGKWTPDNIFTNTTAFNHSLSWTPGIGVNETFIQIANTQGMLYAATTNLLDSSPANPPSSLATIRTQYTCQTLQRKSPGTMVISVLTASLSMFLAIWGVSLSLIGFIADRTRTSRGMNRSH
ncbi:hypothetical protein BDP27DRAFT_1237851, partial [Rhodocollybia butyracea]